MVEESIHTKEQPRCATRGLMGPHEWDEGGAPLFLSPNPGLNSGFMVAQYVAAALVNEIKVLAHPASIDSIPTCAGMEDFVSMGVTSAHKVRHIVEQAQQVISIEMLCAAQMLDIRKPLKPGAGVQKAYELVRSYVPKLEHDRVLAPDIAMITWAVKEGSFDAGEILGGLLFPEGLSADQSSSSRKGQC